MLKYRVSFTLMRLGDTTDKNRHIGGFNMRFTELAAVRKRLDVILKKAVEMERNHEHGK